MSYLLVDHGEEGATSLHLQIFAVIPDLLANDRYDLSLHLQVVLKDVHRVEEYVALLHWVLLRQQELDSLALCQILFYRESLNLFFRLDIRAKE